MSVGGLHTDLMSLMMMVMRKRRRRMTMRRMAWGSCGRDISIADDD